VGAKATILGPGCTEQPTHHKKKKKKKEKSEKARMCMEFL